MKNVLFIVYYFPPMGGSGVQRPFKFAKYLKDFGWNPIILCPEPGAYHTFDQSLNNELKELDITVHRVSGDTPFHKMGGAAKKVNFPGWFEKVIRKISSLFWFPDNKIGWVDPAFKKAIEIISENNIDLIFSSAPPYSNLLLGKKIKEEFGIPLISDMRDDWLKSHLNNYSLNIHSKRMKKLEADTLKTTDFLLTINGAILEGFQKRIKNIDNQNSLVITHGFDPDDFIEMPAVSKVDDKISFLYSGVFYEDSSPKTFLYAVHELISNEEFYRQKIEIRFQGKLRSEDKKLIKKLNLTEIVTDYGYLDHDKAIKNLKEADVLWLNVGQNKNADKISLGKTAEYFATKKPILGLVPEGEAKNLLLNYKRSYLAKPYSTLEVKNQIKQIIEDYDNNKLPEANLEFIEEFDIRRLTENLANVFNTLNQNLGIQS